MGFAANERAAFCDAALAVGPAGATLCEGWTVADLVAHVWTRENDLWAMPGIVLPAFAGVTQRRNDAALDRWGFVGLVNLVASGPNPRSPYGWPGMDDRANTIEFFVHTEDIRRPGALPRRPTERAFEDELWQRLPGIARLFFRKAGTGVRLERSDAPGQIRARGGRVTVTIVGMPSELVLFAFGRTRDADVRLIGPDAAVAALIDGHKAL